MSVENPFENQSPSSEEKSFEELNTSYNDDLRRIYNEVKDLSERIKAVEELNNRLKEAKERHMKELQKKPVEEIVGDLKKTSENLRRNQENYFKKKNIN